MLDIISFIFKFIHSEPHQVWTSDLNSKSGSMIHNNNGHPGKMNMELRSSSYYRDTQLSCAFGEKNGAEVIQVNISRWLPKHALLLTPFFLSFF